MSSVVGYIKLALIPVLAGGLYMVLREEAPSATDNAIDRGPVSSKTGTLLVEAEATNRNAENASLPLAVRDRQPTPPLISYGEVAEVDPFDRKMIFPVKEPSSAVHPSIENDDHSLVSSQGASRKSAETLKVQVVFQTRDGISAMLDDRIVRVGDLLEDGRQVIQITPECLVLASPPIH